MGFLDFIGEPYGKLTMTGLFLLAIGGGLTLWSYANRDPVTGEYFIWAKMMLGGTVSTVAGVVWWKLAG